MLWHYTIFSAAKNKPAVYAKKQLPAINKNAAYNISIIWNRTLV